MARHAANQPASPAFRETADRLDEDSGVIMRHERTTRDHNRSREDDDRRAETFMRKSLSDAQVDAPAHTSVESPA